MPTPDFEWIDDVELKAGICRTVLEDLPAWFGLPEAINTYVEEVQHMPFLAVMGEDTPIGFLALKEHADKAAEVYVMGLDKTFHRQGIGRAMLAQAEIWLEKRGKRYLTVKTLSPGREDANYEKTRAFYAAMGFETLEEFPKLWDEKNPCLFMVKEIAK